MTDETSANMNLNSNLNEAGKDNIQNNQNYDVNDEQDPRSKMVNEDVAIQQNNGKQ